MRRALEWAAFWGFQLAFGGLFAAVFLFVVPSVVEGWVPKALSVALGGCAALAVVLVAVVGALGWWSGPSPTASAVCPHCGQPLPADPASAAEPGAAADPRRPSGSGG